MTTNPRGLKHKNDKCLDLYEKAMVTKVPKRDKTRNDIDFEKGIKELTF
jgi:hypothetical protein